MNGPVTVDPETVAALHTLAAEMLDDGDCYVEHYGRRLADLLRLLAGESREGSR